VTDSFCGGDIVVSQATRQYSKSARVLKEEISATNIKSQTTKYTNE
jgi:hypothetical protein